MLSLALAASICSCVANIGPELEEDAKDEDKAGGGAFGPTLSLAHGGGGAFGFKASVGLDVAAAGTVLIG